MRTEKDMKKRNEKKSAGWQYNETIKYIEREVGYAIYIYIYIFAQRHRSFTLLVVRLLNYKREPIEEQHCTEPMLSLVGLNSRQHEHSCSARWLCSAPMALVSRSPKWQRPNIFDTQIHTHILIHAF
jgi:hypothetical protein